MDPLKVSHGIHSLMSLHIGRDLYTCSIGMKSRQKTRKVKLVKLFPSKGLNLKINDHGCCKGNLGLMGEGVFLEM